MSFSRYNVLSSLSGGQVFSKLDLRQAYAQLKLYDESQKLCVISTHRGLYAFTKLPFGVCSAVANANPFVFAPFTVPGQWLLSHLPVP